MTRLRPEEIDHVRAQHRLVDVLARAGVLDSGATAGGRDFMICCPSPAHDDRTPSCAIHPATDRFYCFGCGAHGDVFTLVTEITGIRSLAQIAEVLDAGGPIMPRSGALAMPSRPVVTGASDSIARPDLHRTPFDRVLACNTEAWTFLTTQRRADRARLYLSRRGIDVWPLESALGRPVAGYTPGDRNGLTRHLTLRGFTLDEAIDAGWTIRAEEGAIDRFRSRVLFPVTDSQDQVLGVIGRDATGCAKRRYLNHPHTVAYCKSEALYAPTSPSRERTIVVCEGPVDALAITALGITAGVTAAAPSGTALTESQARQVLTWTNRRLVLCADGDEAGVTASKSWAATFARLGQQARVVALPAAHDPASWLRERGMPGLLALVPAADRPLAPSQVINV